ncbi:MAG: hypothetical protein IJT41_00515 [Clostridia bacterium]|nr:hypothetical protein [Clostridia bacterium]
MHKLHFSRKSITACIFCALLFVLSALLFLPDKTFSEAEKRVLASPPALRVETLANGKFESRLETYIQDQMAFRNFWVGLCAYFNAAAGQNGTDGVYAGSDGWLIGTPAKENPRNLGSNLRTLNGFAEKVQKPAYLLIVPQTGYVLEEKLPRRHTPYTDDAVFAAAAENAPKLSLVDLRETFRKAQSNTQIYYKTDHHWTSAGALLAANAFLQSAGRPTLSAGDFTIESVPGFYGTTYSRAALWRKQPDTMQLWSIPGAKLSVEVTDLGGNTVQQNSVFFREHLEKYDRYPVYLAGNHSLTHIVNESAPDGSLLLVKDSFGNTLATLLAAAYREIWMVDLRYYRTEAVSDLITQHGIDTLLVNYSTDDLMNDANILWLK